MGPGEWASVIGAILAVLSGYVASIRFLVKHYFSELKPNSGSSMRDEVKVNSARLERLEGRVDSIYEILCKK